MLRQFRIVSQNLLLPSILCPPQGKKKMMQNTSAEYPRTASIIALAGGLIITLGGVLLVAVSAFVLPNLTYANVSIPHGLSASAMPGLVSGFVGLMGIFGLVSGAIVLVSSVMLLTNSGRPRTWSVLILVFSVLSFVGTGGFVVGAVLGLVGGALVLKWKPPALQA
jgi:hypothetical protein